ncbi:uncharacterized protein LOC130895575 [Diorhabda carinulata]|uniref:uncharacterized protein LOC130895575 n=1 Tax=Diorhabda carinulata TaxID=1163345 RepID=UPI0025A1544E|nr:uncharacterized protein LOC130895575 [Diorhabda carinulata]
MDNIYDNDSMEGTSSNVIYITEEFRVEWNHEATKELLKVYDEKYDMLDSGIITTQKKLWELVAKDMNKKDFFYTGAQCENKWKTLKRNYKNKLLKMDKTGSCKRQCPFEREIVEILSKRPHESMFNRSYNYSKHFSKVKDESSDEATKESPSNHPKQDIKEETFVDELIQNPDYVIEETATSSQVAEELAELRKSVMKQNKINAELVRQSNEFQYKIVQHLDAATQRECQNLELKETRMEQQNEIIKQMKIQNNLLQKLLEKMG